MRNRWAVLKFSLFIAAAGCGGGGTDEQAANQQTAGGDTEQMTAEAEKMIDQQLEALRDRESQTFPCAIYTHEEIESLVGNSLQKGSYAFEHRSEDDSAWRSESCSWSLNADEGTELSLWVSRPEHFDSGQVTCVPPIGAGDNNPYAPKAIDGVGNQAWWQFDKSGSVGTLRGCSPKALFEIWVDLEGEDAAAAEKLVRTVAERILNAVD